MPSTRIPDSLGTAARPRLLRELHARPALRGQEVTKLIAREIA
jgi:hypothetical protein